VEKAKTICLTCGAVNAYPLETGGKKVVCGRCKTPLPPPGGVLDPGLEAEFEILISNGSLPVLVDFASQTCAPCHLMHPILERLAARRAGEIVVVRVDVERHPELAARFGIRAVPTFVVLSRGYETARTTGAMSESDFSLWAAGAAR
jgi:thioredoxin 2